MMAIHPRVVKTFDLQMWKSSGGWMFGTYHMALFISNDVMCQQQPLLTTFIFRESKPWFFNVHQKDSCWLSSDNIKNRCLLPLMNKCKPQDILLQVSLQSLPAQSWKRTSPRHFLSIRTSHQFSFYNSITPAEVECIKGK